ncbi:hypothetical protein C4E22_01780 [ANME-1 cluster archaeon AG-394-G06]|nr:hypothetical protein [ANME-1 cluster archaeon AG-394-G06]
MEGVGKRKMIKLLIIGLDGATFRVINPLSDEGKLPTLKKLITNGVHGTLESTFPPVTGPAWPALATGKNPGKTGVFDFLNRISSDGFETKAVSSSEIRKAKPYWDYLSHAGIKTGVVNYPCLYPPYKINGIMVSGLGSDPRDDISYPKEFKQLLIENCGNYRIVVPWHDPLYTENPSLFVEHIFDLIEINYKTMQLLLKQDLEVITFVISASDFTQHYMWRYIDPTHPYYSEEGAEKYKPAFVQIWQRIDKIISLVVKATSQKTNILIVSDHGFGPHRSSFYTNSWLEKEGYLKKRSELIKLRQLQRAVANLIRKISPALHDKLIKAVQSGRVHSIPVTAEVDFKRSLAFAPVNASLVGKICLNEPAILSSRGYHDSNVLKDEIIEKLKKTCSNLGVSVRVYSPDELYLGEYVNLAPNILFEIDDFECSIYFGFNKEVYQKPSPNPVYSGAHKKEGVFIAYGPDIKEEVQIQGAKIYDIAPTILHMFGLSVPDDMDGRLLKEIFKEGSEPAQRAVRYQAVDMEREKVKDQIKKLKESGRL